MALLDERSRHPFDVRGTTRLFDLRVDEAGWSMVRRAADFWQRSAARFVGSDRTEGSGENCADGGGSWTHADAVSYARTR